MDTTEDTIAIVHSAGVAVIAIFQGLPAFSCERIAGIDCAGILVVAILRDIRAISCERIAGIDCAGILVVASDCCIITKVSRFFYMPTFAIGVAYVCCVGVAIITF
jgi:hypothetical protein